MRKSPVYPKHETNDYNGDEYDPHAEFFQFLEEAKRNERKMDVGISSANTGEAGKRKPHQEKMKKKKPWKVFLLPWWKGERKRKSHMEPATNSHASNRRKGFASGPVYSSGKEPTGGRPRHPTSGPLTSLFNPKKKSDAEIPYMCLDQLGSAPAAQNQTYGPVYLVT